MSIARGWMESPSVASEVSHHDNKPRWVRGISKPVVELGTTAKPPPGLKWLGRDGKGADGGKGNRQK